jgi:GDP-L-fucose synthase
MKNYFENKKILIAGGSGLVGTNLLIKLIDLKAQVEASYNTKMQAKEHSKFYKKYNFLNKKDCHRATKNKDIVYICVVKGSGIKKIRENFFKNIQDNLLLRLNILEACKKNRVKKIIWVSSSTTYQSYNKKIKEKDLDLNKDPYDIYYGIGWTYRYLEKIFNYFQNYFNMDIKIIRTSSVYGPYDNFNLQTSHVIPALIKKSLDKKKIIEVWGNKKVTRDFVYISDLINFLLSVTMINKKLEPINFSHGKPTTIETLAKKISYLTKKKIKFKSKQYSSASYRVLNNQLANNIKKIERTNLNDGLIKTIDWYKNN